MKKLLSLFLLFAIAATSLHAQGSAGSGSIVEPRYLVDVPTAGLLAKGSMAFDFDFYQEGGILFGVTFGVWERLNLGLSYGGSKLIGGSQPEMNELPGVNVKLRLIEESTLLPAIALGFDTQGKEGYLEKLNRYSIKSPGFYAAASKNYSLAGFFSIHGGVNYSLERADGDKDVNLFVGVEKSIGSFISALLEYNVATNDNSGAALGRGRGYLNGALRFHVAGGLTLGVTIKDLMKNGSDVSVGNRTAQIEYVTNF